eukprot:PhM_4_TR9185/c0_g1_i1/m.67716
MGSAICGSVNDTNGRGTSAPSGAQSGKNQPGGPSAAGNNSPANNNNSAGTAVGAGGASRPPQRTASADAATTQPGGVGPGPDGGGGGVDAALRPGFQGVGADGNGLPEGVAVAGGGAQGGPLTCSFVARRSEQPEVNYDELVELWRVYNNVRRRRLDNDVFINVVDGVVQHARRRRTGETQECEYQCSITSALDPLVVDFVLRGSGYEHQGNGKFAVHHTVCDHQLHGIITFLDQAKHQHSTPLFVFHSAVLAPIAEAGDEPESYGFDADDMINTMLNKAQLPSANSILQMLMAAKRILRDEPNVVTVPAPCVLVGDIHGQFYDLRDRVFAYGGMVDTVKYVFLGDYVDRGENSLLCATLLMTLKVRYPDQIYLLRGNHESKMTNNIYGFQQECRTTFPELSQGILMEHPMWASFNNAFDLLPLMAIVGNRVMCMHGGLSPEFQTPAHVMTVERGVEVEANQLMSDITWSDPTPSEGFYGNLRGLGHLFGPDVTHHVLRINHMTMLVRAHQCVKSGFQFDHSEYLVTLFSAPNYCNLGNKGAILVLDAQLNMTFTVYDPAPKPVRPGAGAEGQGGIGVPAGIGGVNGLGGADAIAPPDARNAPPYFWQSSEL